MLKYKSLAVSSKMYLVLIDSQIILKTLNR